MSYRQLWNNAQIAKSVEALRMALSFIEILKKEQIELDYQDILKELKARHWNCPKGVSHERFAAMCFHLVVLPNAPSQFCFD